MNRKEPLFRVVKRESVQPRPPGPGLCGGGGHRPAHRRGPPLLHGCGPPHLLPEDGDHGHPGQQIPLAHRGELRQALCPPAHHLPGPVAGLPDALLEHRRRGAVHHGRHLCRRGRPQAGPGPAPAPGGAGHGPVRHPGRRPVRPDRGPAEGALQHQRDPAHPDAQLHRPLSPPVPGGDQGWLELLPGPRFRPTQVRRASPTTRT